MKNLFKYTNKKTQLSLYFLTLLGSLALVIPLLPLDPNAFNPEAIGIPLPPSFSHWFGTDDLGRDVLLRCIYGSRISLAVGFISVGISIFIGTCIGLIAGYSGGLIDTLMMRGVDLFMAIPTIFLILAIQVILTPSIYNIMIVIGLTSWMGVARMVRSEVLSIKERPFITAIKARGFQEIRILFKHIFPHTLSPIIVAGMLGMGSAILTESVLSYLGLGVQPPHASWGNMLENSLTYMIDAPWLAIIPGILITLTVLSLNFIGDSLRAYFNPKERQA